jgi:hypothetical protein
VKRSPSERIEAEDSRNLSEARQRSESEIERVSACRASPILEEEQREERQKARLFFSSPRLVARRYPSSSTKEKVEISPSPPPRQSGNLEKARRSATVLESSSGRKRELTVSDLLIGLNVGLGVDDNLLDAVDGDDLGRAVGHAAVVDETSARMRQGEVSSGAKRSESNRTHPKLPFLVASTTRSSSTRKR